MLQTRRLCTPCTAACNLSLRSSTTAILDGGELLKTWVAYLNIIRALTEASAPAAACCRLLETLREAFNPEGAGRNLFFSYGADLTLHAQRQADVLADPVQAAKPLHARADRRFFWNRFMAKPLVDAGADK
jgi:hypothetical protein